MRGQPPALPPGRALPPRRRHARAPPGQALVEPALALHVRQVPGPVHHLLGEPGQVPVKRLLNLFCDATIWIAVCCTASGAGLLLAAVAHH